MKRFWLVSLVLATFAVTAPLAAQMNDLNTFGQTEPLIYDDAERERAQQRVISVAAELRELLTRPSQALGPIAVVDDPPVFVEITNSDNTGTLIYSCRYTTAKSIADTISVLSSNRGDVEANTEQNKIVVTDEADRMEMFRKTILALDTPSPQVLIEAKVIEVLITDDTQRNLSISFNQKKEGLTFQEDGKGGYGSNIPIFGSGGFMSDVIGSDSANAGGVVDLYPYANSNENVHVFFQWLMTAQDAKIISSPTILISRGDVMNFKTGQDIPIQEQTQNSSSISFSTTYRNIGVKLSVTPKIINRNSVMLTMLPEVSNILQYERIAASGVSYQVPIISVRSMETDLTIYNGQAVMIGGLFNTREVVDQQRIPFLSDIPYLGEMFTSKSSTKEVIQLIFVMRATIIMPNELNDGVLFDPAQQAAESLELSEAIKHDSIFPPLGTTIDKIKEEFSRDDAPSMREFNRDEENRENDSE